LALFWRVQKIWLTQEADAKSWSSLKHVQPKEGRKELAPREIKFRYRRLDTAIARNPRESRQFPREAQESVTESEKDTPGYFSLFLFSSYLFLIRDVAGESSRHGRGGESPMAQTWVQNRERRSPTIS
jgi:hypothetical protein